MTTTTLVPTSTAGLKRLAHQLRKHRDLTQSEAMDHAAVLAGYGNLREAQLAFGETPAPSVLITAQFCDDVSRRTLETRVRLSQSLRAFLRPKHLRTCDRFAKMTMVADDHIEADFSSVQKSFVRQSIAQAARTLQFMDATGLKPSTNEIYGYDTYSKEQRIPGQDHAITWFDPETKALVMMDEPNGPDDELTERRNAWARQNGFEIHRLNWGGTYRSEPGSVCDLVCQAGQGAFIDQIIAKLEGAAPRFSEDRATWTFHVEP